MTTAVAEGAVAGAEGATEAVAPKKGKKAAVVIEVTHLARRFRPTCNTGTLKDPLKGLWTVDGEKGFYCFAGNLKPSVQPQVKEGQIVAKYDANGTMSPAIFERIPELEEVLVKQIQG